MNNHLFIKFYILLLLSTLFPSLSMASEEETTTVPTQSSEKTNDPSENYRNFYEVFDDVMGDFEYDLKNGQVTGLKDLAIRNIATSENIPSSFKHHIELAVTERILKTTKTRVIQCLACKAKRSILKGDQVVITSPETNPAELSRIAKTSNISNFMDISFAYHPSGMVLSMSIVDPESGGIVWSRTYNSETSRASAFKRGVDFSQVDEARKNTEYQPMIQYRLALYYLYEKDISEYTGTLGLAFRMMERYDNRHKEVGFEADYLRTVSSIIGSATTSGSTLYGTINLTLLFIHSWNLIGGEENFNMVRGNIFIGIGGTYASGFLGGLVRAGYEWRLAKHWAVSSLVGYRPKATLFISSGVQESVSGIEAGLGISGLF